MHLFAPKADISYILISPIHYTLITVSRAVWTSMIFPWRGLKYINSCQDIADKTELSSDTMGCADDIKNSLHLYLPATCWS